MENSITFFVRRTLQLVSKLWDLLGKRYTLPRKNEKNRREVFPKDISRICRSNYADKFDSKSSKEGNSEPEKTTFQSPQTFQTFPSSFRFHKTFTTAWTQIVWVESYLRESKGILTLFLLSLVVQVHFLWGINLHEVAHKGFDKMKTKLSLLIVVSDRNEKRGNIGELKR